MHFKKALSLLLAMIIMFGAVFTPVFANSLILEADSDNKNNITNFTRNETGRNVLGVLEDDNLEDTLDIGEEIKNEALTNDVQSNPDYELTDNDIIWGEVGQMKGLKNSGLLKIDKNNGNLVLPASVKRMAEDSLYNIASLKSVKAEGVTVLDKPSIINDCKNLENIDFPNLETIDTYNVVKGENKLPSVLTFPKLQGIPEVFAFSFYDFIAIFGDENAESSNSWANNFNVEKYRHDTDEILMTDLEFCISDDYWDYHSYVEENKYNRLPILVGFKDSALKKIAKNNGTLKLPPEVTRINFSYVRGKGQYNPLEKASASVLNTIPGLKRFEADGLTSLPPALFYGCQELEFVSISNIKKIDSGVVFKNCPKLKSVSMKNLETIGRRGTNLFDNCTSLENINIPNIKEILADEVFRGCTSLKTFNSDTLENLFSFNAFDGCKNLEEINLPSLTKLGGWDDHMSIFKDCNSLKEVNLPSLAKLGEYGLYGDAFFTDDSLKRMYYVTINNTLDEGIVDFNTVYNYKEVSGDITDDDIIWKDRANGVMVNLTNTGKLKLISNGGKLILPDSVKVISAKDDMVYGIRDMIEETLGPIVKSVKAKNLKTLNSPIFSLCGNLEKIDFPNLETINGNYSFYGDVSLNNGSYLCKEMVKGDIYMPKLTTINGNGTFGRCTSLQFLNLPNLKDCAGESGSLFISLENRMELRVRIVYELYKEINDISYGTARRVSEERGFRDTEFDNLDFPDIEKKINNSASKVPIKKLIVNDDFNYKNISESKSLDNMLYFPYKTTFYSPFSEPNSKDFYFDLAPKKFDIFTKNRTNPNGILAEGDYYRLNNEKDNLCPVNYMTFNLEKSFTLNGNKIDIDNIKINNLSHFSIRCVSNNINTGISTSVSIVDKDGNISETFQTDDNGFGRSAKEYDFSKEYYYQIGNKKMKINGNTNVPEIPKEYEFQLIRENKVSKEKTVVKDFTLNAENKYKFSQDLLEPCTYNFESGEEESYNYYFVEKTKGNFTTRFTVDSPASDPNTYNFYCVNEFEFEPTGLYIENEFSFTPNTGVRSFK